MCVLVVRVQPGIQILSAIRKPVVRQCLDGPLAHKDREFAITSKRLCVCADASGDVIRIAGAAKVVVVHIEHNVCARSKVSRPEWLSLETALEHDWDLWVHGFGMLDHGVDVFLYPGSTTI